MLEREPAPVMELYRNCIDPRVFVDAREEGPSLQIHHAPIPGRGAQDGLFRRVQQALRRRDRAYPAVGGLCAQRRAARMLVTDDGGPIIGTAKLTRPQALEVRRALGWMCALVPLARHG